MGKKVSYSYSLELYICIDHHRHIIDVGFIYLVHLSFED